MRRLDHYDENGNWVGSTDISDGGCGGSFLGIVVCVFLFSWLLSLANPIIFFVLKRRDAQNKPKFYKEELVFKVSKIWLILQMVSLIMWFVMEGIPSIIVFLELR